MFERGGSQPEHRTIDVVVYTQNDKRLWSSLDNSLRIIWRKTGRQAEEDSPEAQSVAQLMSKVREIIEVSELLKHLIEQHPPSDGDSESVSGIIGRALQPYVDQLNHHHNALRQRQITDFFHQQQQPPQPPVLRQADFESFQEDDKLLEELVPGGDH
ncbi:uncharacterized protein LOC121870404 [Homarus americanus]|uniref:uncharacterized protein LOC121870404 n=1 Tax=Homarus americanus TaxID=6706 RepID=UPI001C4948EF|nr:uncharacterized protein LOC121870404 [Homarus americanus]